jgi:uncharacterized protein YqcC (DUF446 family)
MSIKNGDMPVMPTLSVSNDGAPYYKALPSNGLTKLEHFAGLAIPPMEVIIEAMKECNGSVSIDDYIEYAVAYKIKEAKALLSQLEEKASEL